MQVKELRVKTYKGKYLTSTVHTEITRSSEIYNQLTQDNDIPRKVEVITNFPVLGGHKQIGNKLLL